MAMGRDNTDRGAVGKGKKERRRWTGIQRHRKKEGNRMRTMVREQR